MSIKSLVLNTGLKLKKNAPTLMIFGGVATMAVGTVFACKATTKLADKVVKPSKEELDVIHKAKEECKPEEYSKKDYAADICKSYAKTAGRTAKLYAFPALVFTTGAFLIFKGHNMMAARNAAIAAAYKALETHFDNYRSTVRDLYGEAVENDIFRGVQTDHAVVTELKEDGTEESHVETFKSAPAEGTPCSFWYDNEGFNSVDDSYMYNSDFISSAIRQCKRDFQLTKRKTTLADLMKYLSAKDGTIPPWAYTFGRMYPSANSTDLCDLDIQVEPMYKRDERGNIDHDKRYFYITVNGYHDISNEMYASSWKRTEKGIELNA